MSAIPTEPPVEPRPLNEMTDSEKIDEMLTIMRTVGQALAEMQKSGPMKMIAGMMGGGRS
jgi:hypothetical protein